MTRLLALAMCTSLAVCPSLSLLSCSGSPPQPPGPHQVPLPRVDDRWESFNRSMWGFNDGLLRHVIAPIGTGYRVLVPRFARTGLRNLFENLGFPKRFFSSLSQGLWGGSGRETARFLINTTVGIVGLFDVGDELGIEPSDEDFGQAFSAGGWNNTRYLILPFGGPGTARDAVGGLLDRIFDLSTYIPGSGVLRGINNGSDDVLGYLPLADSTFDLYRLAQLKHHFDREKQNKNLVHDRDRCELCTVDGSALSVPLVPNDPEFSCDVEERTVTVTSTGKELPYSAWIQPHPAPMLYILPGLGGHRNKRSTHAMAELAYSAGFSAVALGSAMNFEFIQTAATTDVSGFAPHDAIDVHRAIEEIHDDLDVAYPDRTTARAVMGLSLGGLHALFLADHERLDDPSLRPFDAYLAINPPVKLAYSSTVLDASYDLPLAMPKSERQTFVDHAIRKAIELTENQPGSENEVFLTEREAWFLIGLSFRQVLGDVIDASQRLRQAGTIHSPPAGTLPFLPKESIGIYPFRAYFDEMVLPYYAARDPAISKDAAGAATLFARCDVRSIEPTLKENPRVQVMTNRDDFLIDADDLAWLEETLGIRLQTFDRGGHLGNLHVPEVQQRLMDMLRDSLGFDPAAQ